MGWHPKKKDGEDGLKTEDLPWARVGMPTTYAASRVGGKHGILPGSWVFDFLDGEEANDPFILSIQYDCQGSNEGHLEKIK